MIIIIALLDNINNKKRPSPFKGKKHTEKTKQKIRDNHAHYWIGKKMSKESQIKRLKSRGQKPINTKEEWKKMRSKSSKKEYNKHKNDYKRRQDYFVKRAKLLKSQVFMHYCNGVIQCACCGELIEEFLTIDHISGRKNYNHSKSSTGYILYSWIIQNDFPDGFQILCMNCNWAKGMYEQCPHQTKKSLRIKTSLLQYF